MKKLQLAAVLAVGAVLGYVGARSDVPLPSQAAPVKQSVSKEPVADKPATTRVQVEPLRNICCADPSTRTEPVELADAGFLPSQKEGRCHRYTLNDSLQWR